MWIKLRMKLKCGKCWNQRKFEQKAKRNFSIEKNRFLKMKSNYQVKCVSLSCSRYFSFNGCIYSSFIPLFPTQGHGGWSPTSTNRETHDHLDFESPLSLKYMFLDCRTKCAKPTIHEIWWLPLRVDWSFAECTVPGFLMGGRADLS